MMRLISAHIEGFGILQNADLDFVPGLNTVLRDNGGGKSTLAAFICAMLYGLEGRGQDELKSERKRWEPWQGGVYGGRLKFEAGGRTYILNRTFGETKKKDSFSLLDDETKLESRDFSDSVGQELFGLDAESFKRTVFISQNDCATSATDGVNAKLGDMTEITGDMGDYDRAQATINDMLNKLSPDRKTGSISRLKDEVSGLESELRGADGVDRSLEEKTAALKRAKDGSSKLELTRDGLREKQDRADAVNGLLDRLEEYERLRSVRDRRGTDRDRAEAALGGRGEGDLEEIKRTLSLCGERSAAAKRAAELREQLGRAEAGKAGRGPSIPALIIGLALLLAGLIAAGLGFTPGLICSALGIGAAGAAFLPMLKKTGNADTEELRAELDKSEEGAAEIEAKLAASAAKLGLSPDPDGLPEALYGLRSELERLFGDLRHAAGELDHAEKELRDFEAANDTDKLRAAATLERTDTRALVGEIRAVEDSLKDAVYETDALERELDGLRARRDELDEKAEELEAKKAELAAREESRRLLTLTGDLLRTAKDNLTARYMDPILEGFRKYYSMMNGEGAEAFDIDARISIGVNEAGRRRDVRLLSQGRRDLAGICQRMAMIDAMYPGEKPFVVLDDPFTNLDGERLRGGLDFLTEAAKEYQIIYFTCHESRTPAASHIL